MIMNPEVRVIKVSRISSSCLRYLQPNKSSSLRDTSRAHPQTISRCNKASSDESAIKQQWKVLCPCLSLLLLLASYCFRSKRFSISFLLRFNRFLPSSSFLLAPDCFPSRQESRARSFRIFHKIKNGKVIKISHSNRSERCFFLRSTLTCGNFSSLNMTQIFSRRRGKKRENFREMSWQAFRESLSAFISRKSDSKQDGEKFSADDSTCDRGMFIVSRPTGLSTRARKSARGARVIKTRERNYIAGEEIRHSIRLGTQMAAAQLPNSYFATIYSHSGSVSVYFYQQQNENRKM